MPALYTRSGLRFEYPENWQLEESSVDLGDVVSVASPGGAFWSLTVYPGGGDPGPLVQAVLETVRGQYDNLDVEPSRLDLAGFDVEGYEVNFYCLDLLSRLKVWGFRQGRATYLLLWQAEDRDYSQVEPIFQAMTVSLLRTVCATEEN